VRCPMNRELILCDPDRCDRTCDRVSCVPYLRTRIKVSGSARSTMYEGTVTVLDWDEPLDSITPQRLRPLQVLLGEVTEPGAHGVDDEIDLI
jgi:hypothetical protein